MADFTIMATALADPTFINRIGAGCLVSAFSIINEAGTVPNHTNRLTWATKLRQDSNFGTDTARKLMRVAAPQDTNFQTKGVTMTDTEIGGMIATVTGDATLLALIMWLLCLRRSAV